MYNPDVVPINNSLSEIFLKEVILFFGIVWWCIGINLFWLSFNRYKSPHNEMYDIESIRSIIG